MRRLALLLLALWTAPAWAQAPSCPFAGQSVQLVVQMFFGQSVGRASGSPGLISRRAWERFVADTITASLPGGFTLYAASGQWQDPTTRVIGREPTEVLVVASPDSPAFRAAIAAIADAYRHRFDQRSVGIVSTPACSAF